MCPGDLPGDAGQGPIAGSLMVEAVLRHCDGMGAAMPFADKPRAGLEAQAGGGADTAACLPALRHRLQLAAGRLAETAMRLFLEPGRPTPEQTARG